MYCSFIVCVHHVLVSFLLESIAIFLGCLYTPGRFSAIVNKRDNFCDFLFAFLHTRILLEKGLKEGIINFLQIYVGRRKKVIFKHNYTAQKGSVYRMKNVAVTNIAPVKIKYGAS